MMEQFVPYFEDFSVGDDLSDVPSVTITAGHTAVHQAMFGDRLKLALDHPLCHAVTGHDQVLVSSSLVCNMAIGLSTIPSQRVMGNLFYRGLVLRRPVFIGDTLTTTTKVVGLRQNKLRPGRASSGMVALEIEVQNQRHETVMHFWRCPMIPCRDDLIDTGHTDDFSFMPEALALSDLEDAVPNWDYNQYRKMTKGIGFVDLAEGMSVEIEAKDTVTLAPELVRMSMNIAMTHTDAGQSVYGRRLVYGGHTITMAAAQLLRVMPNMLSVLGWYKCDHLAPVFEEDVLQSRVTIERLTAVKNAGLIDLHIQTFAVRPDSDTANVQVLDWKLAVLCA
jgi:2-methylfumaryl-CoA hydratase